MRTYGFRLRCVAGLLSFVLPVMAVAQSSGGASAPAKPAMNSAKLHQKLIDRTIGKGVKVTETDGTQVSGVLVAIDAESFQVTPKNTTHPVVIANDTVTKVGNTGLSTASKIGIGIGIGIVAFILFIVISLKSAGF